MSDVSLTVILHHLHQLHVLVEPPDGAVVGGEGRVESHVASVVPYIVTVPDIRTLLVSTDKVTIKKKADQSQLPYTLS